MIKILIGITLDNPNETNSRSVRVKIYPDNQEVFASYINPLTLDHREQRPNVKVGSEVFVLVDKLYNYYILGTTQQGIQLVDKKIYKIENSDEIQILTDKELNITSISNSKIEKVNLKAKELKEDLDTKEIQLNTIKIQNSTAELISVLSDTLQALIDLEIIGNLGQPAYDSPDTKQTFKDLKSKIDSFKM